MIKFIQKYKTIIGLLIPTLALLWMIFTYFASDPNVNDNQHNKQTIQTEIANSKDVGMSIQKSDIQQTTSGNQSPAIISNNVNIRYEEEKSKEDNK